MTNTSKALSSRSSLRRRSRKKENNYGKAWKLARERSKLTQAEVADALGYSCGQFISNVESGRCRFPGAQLLKVQKLYSLTTNQMLEMVLSEEEERLRIALNR